MEQEQKKSLAAKREEKVLEFWRENKVFEQSLEKASPKGNYVFYDGPPFATGQMHYGHILGSTAKDAIGRYQTMQGFHVPRRWGWDCHGLPIENIVEKELGIAGHKEIEALGIEKFVEYARSKVLEYDKDWEKGVERIGRWVDFKGGYKTMDNTFIESVWWALSELNNKGLIYEGVRVLAYCSRCETPIANSEIAMDNSYKDITDISVYVKFELVDEPGTYLLAWTTTPWTLPGNFALAVNPDFNYVKVKIGEASYILGKERLSVLKDPYEIVEENLQLVGKSYKPLFDYFLNADMPNKGNAWKVYGASYVTNDAGTGIVHTSPGYGEEDMELAKRENIPFIHHVLNNGVFAEAVKDFIGLPVKAKSSEKDGHQKTDIEIIKHLAHQGHLFAKEKIVHSYPHCMRCDTPIIYYALPSWFVNIQKVKSDIVDASKSMNWIPSHLKEGRFKNNLESAPDWTISRNRYWASPLPIWKSESGKMIFVSSVEDLKKHAKKSGNSYFVMRHGGTEGNSKGIVSFKEQENDHLTEKGKQQVRSEIGHYKGKIDLIIASPFTRTRETAEIVREELGLDAHTLIIDERLHEVNAGDFDGKSWDDYHNFVYNMGQGWYERKIPNGESLQEVGKRVGEALYDLEEKYKGKNILIVTHGGPAWLCYVVSGEYVPENQEYQIANSHAFVKEFKRFQNGEIRKLDFVPLPHNARYELDLHRPYIDSIKLVDENGEEYTRIPEVIDCWFESGSMPFAQDHFPFENPNWQKDNFPAGFVAEYIAQTRTWFYYSLVISTLLFGKAPFENVVTTGTLRAEDGQKISKSKKNYPDPWIFIDKYGVDPLRLYLMSGPLMKGEDANFSEKLVADIASKIIGRLYNVVAFYELYRDKDLEIGTFEINHALDQWILSRMNEVVAQVAKGMELYDMAEATRPLDLFVDDLSTWYLRRSRDRLKDGDKEAKQTLYVVLKTISKILAPFAPFTAEDVWQKLKNEKDEMSVHLATWPEAGKTNEEVVKNMQLVRDICTAGNAERKKLNIPVRQPLLKITTKQKVEETYAQLIQDELNVKEVVTNSELSTEVELDTNITPELKKEGDYRELVRAVQDLRKKMELTPSDRVSLAISKEGEELLKDFMQDFQKTVQADSVSFDATDGDLPAMPEQAWQAGEVKVGEQNFIVKISKN